MVQTSFTITDSLDLANDISLIDAGGVDAAISTDDSFTLELSGTSTIALTAQFDAINLGSGSSLSILGDNDTIDGGGSINGFFVYAGTVTIQDLTMQNARAVGGAGGSGSYGGGGGAGLGGACS